VPHKRPDWTIGLVFGPDEFAKDRTIRDHRNTSNAGIKKCGKVEAKNEIVEDEKGVR
jgi:hypothetical protein